MVVKLIKNELHLARILKEKLAPSFEEIYTNINLASNRFYPHWAKWHGQQVPSAQPQIDLLLVDTNLWLLAAELKYYRKTAREEINLPFYAGIDEALAMLRFGFHVVSLWHFYDNGLEVKDVRRLYQSCDHLIWNLNLPINYQAYRLVETDTEVEFYGLYDGGNREWKELPRAYGKKNPFDSIVDAQRIQDFLRTVLKIPHQR